MKIVSGPDTLMYGLPDWYLVTGTVRTDNDDTIAITMDVSRLLIESGGWGIVAYVFGCITEKLQQNVGRSPSDWSCAGAWNEAHIAWSALDEDGIYKW
jgi:hypothetical protein